MMMTKLASRIGLMACIVASAWSIGQAPAQAQQQPPIAEPRTADGETVVGSIRARLTRPAQGHPVNRLTVCFGGGTSDLAQLHQFVVTKLSRPSDVVFTPIPLQLSAQPVQEHFVAPNRFDTRAYRDERVLARALSHRALTDLMSDEAYRGLPLRIVGWLDGSVTAADLLVNDDVRAAELVLIAPDLEEMDPLRNLIDKADDPAAAWRRMPRIDVFLNVPTPAGLTDQTSMLKRRLGPLHDTARVYVMRAPTLSAEALFDKVAETICTPRIIATANRRVLDMAELTRELAAADVVIVGEQHDSIATQQFQADLLRALAGTSRPTAVAMEMFERDVQPTMDRYLRGEISEAEFLGDSRPWPNYHTSYRELIEVAKHRQLPVIAANVPRRYASLVARNGVEALDTLPEAERSFAARQLRAIDGAYKDKFFGVMREMMSHGSHGGNGATISDERLFRMYAAQALKDDTMAESIADFLSANSTARVLHVNGGFHSDNRLGVVEKLKALRPDLKIAVISCEPTVSPALIPASRANPALADYHVFVAMTHPEPKQN